LCSYFEDTGRWKKSKNPVIPIGALYIYGRKILTFSEVKGEGALEVTGLDHQVASNIFSYSDEEYRQREEYDLKQ
jgi:hypothetical protein